MLTDQIISLLNVPEELTGDMHTYLVYVFTGFFAVFLYNYISNILRGMGNSTLPLIFLGVSVALNVGLDLLFVIPLGMGIMGAALATAIAQYVSGVGVLVYFIAAYPEFRLTRRDMRWDSPEFSRSILSLSGFTCLQQSVMNLGILMVQTVVNSFGSDGHGGVFGSCEDRHDRVHAGSGLRQCVLSVHRPELRRGQE